MQDYNDFSSLIEILWALTQANSDIDSTNIEQLSLLASRASKPGSLARNVLVANGIIDYNEPIYLSNDLKSSILIPDNPNQGHQNIEILHIFPNPAKEYIIVSYNLKSCQGELNVSISSIDGIPCYAQNLNGMMNQVVVPLSGFSPSTYVIQLKNEGTIIASSKFVIIK
jgi:hypothetical protein